MFEFLTDAPREERKVANYKMESLVIDTCAVCDIDKSFETGISHKDYNNGNWIIVEEYDTKEQSIKGHNKWIKIMTKKSLPKSLKDISTSSAKLLGDIVYKRDMQNIIQKRRTKCLED